jgi:hypothetical protein
MYAKKKRKAYEFPRNFSCRQMNGSPRKIFQYISVKSSG